MVGWDRGGTALGERPTDSEGDGVNYCLDFLLHLDDLFNYNSDHPRCDQIQECPFPHPQTPVYFSPRILVPLTAIIFFYGQCPPILDKT